VPQVRVRFLWMSSLNTSFTVCPDTSFTVFGYGTSSLSRMAGLEIRRRALSKELAHVNGEMSRLNLEIRVLGIEIPWLARGRRGGIR
jgi:hypothetical protein